MKPGDSTRPSALIVRRAGPPPPTWVIATIRSPVIATSAARPGAPVPSTTRASVISRSVGTAVSAGPDSEVRPDHVDHHRVGGVRVVDHRDHCPLVEGRAGMGDPEA